MKKKFLKFFLLSAFLFLLGMVQVSWAADLEFTPKINIGNYQFDPTAHSTKNIAEYIKAVYQYFLGVVGVLATIILMVGGIIWITAGGNTNRVGEAKKWIGGAITGLVLALTSYLILATINPALVNFTITEIAPVSPADNTKKLAANEVFCEYSTETNIICVVIEKDKCDNEGGIICKFSCNNAGKRCLDCEEECGSSGYQYDPKANKCNCAGSGSHQECQLVSVISGSSSYQCITVPFAGTDTCTSDQSCRQQIGCCICSIKSYGITAYKSCTSGANFTSIETCKEHCGSWFDWSYTPSAICNADKECVLQ